MKRKVVIGIAAGVAAISATAGGVTYAAFSDSVTIGGNTVGAAILRIDFSAGTSAATPISFTDLAPGDPVRRAVWVASNTGASTPDATLTVTPTSLVDTPAACSVSLGKAQAEQQIANGCTIANNVATGIPTAGLFSQVLAVTAGYYAGVTDPADCTQDVAARAPDAPIWSGAAGNLPGVIDHPQRVLAGPSTPLVLAPGQGVCLAISAEWPMSGSGPSTTDRAAQGDALTFDLRFDLAQA